MKQIVWKKIEERIQEKENVYQLKSNIEEIQKGEMRWARDKRTNEGKEEEEQRKEEKGEKR